MAEKLEFLDNAGVARIATLETSHERFMMGYDSPNWIVDGTNTEWIRYLGGDGGDWESKVHYNDGGVVGTNNYFFENRHPGGNSNHTDPNQPIEFRNHQNNRVRVGLIPQLNADTHEVSFTFDINIE